MEPYFIATRNCWVKMVVIIHEIPSLWSSTGPKKASCMCNSKSIIKYRKPLMCTMPQQEGRYLTTTLSFSSPHNILIPLICHKYKTVDDRSISYSWCYCSQMLYLYGNGLLQVIHSQYLYCVNVHFLQVFLVQGAYIKYKRNLPYSSVIFTIINKKFETRQLALLVLVNTRLTRLTRQIVRR